jgi:glutathione S-transferase
VLDGVLVDKEYLVGNKLTIADMSFVLWNTALPELLEDSDAAQEVKNLKNFVRWQAAVLAHPSVEKASTTREKVLAAASVW